MLCRCESKDAASPRLCLLPVDMGRRHQERRSLRSVICLQINEALNDTPQENVLDFSMRNEVEQILSVGKRIAACMARCDSAKY